MTEKRETYGIDIAGIHRELELFEIKPGLRYCYFEHPW